MKARFILLILLLSVGFTVGAQNPVIDTTTAKKLKEVSKLLLTNKQKVDSLIQFKPTTADAKPQRPHLSFQQKLIVLSPVILSLVFILYVSYRLRKEHFKLSDALAADEPVTRQIINPYYNKADPAAQPATITVNDYPKSSSRIVVFFSGLATVMISITSVSYFFYINFRTGNPPDLGKLYDVLLALGIGVVPYAFSKVADAVKK